MSNTEKKQYVNEKIDNRIHGNMEPQFPGFEVIDQALESSVSDLKKARNMIRNHRTQQQTARKRSPSPILDQFVEQALI